MNENTVKLLEQLAQQLGTTAEYLWSVLILQAYVNSIILLIGLLVTIIVGIVLFKTHKRLSKIVDEQPCKYELNEGLLIPVMCALTVLWGIFFIATMFSIIDIISGFINPGYWALNEILKHIN